MSLYVKYAPPKTEIVSYLSLHNKYAKTYVLRTAYISKLIVSLGQVVQWDLPPWSLFTAAAQEAHPRK